MTVVKQLVITTGDSLTALNAFGTVTAALQKLLLSLVCLQNFTVIPELKGEVTKKIKLLVTAFVHLVAAETCFTHL